MKRLSFSRRNPLNALLWRFRKEFYVVGLFSAVVNLLMLTPSLYMLQVFDRVLVGRNEMTLLMLSLITLFLFLVVTFADWSRSRLLVRAGLRFDALVNTKVFNAAFEASLNKAGRNPREAFTDLVNLRQFMTGSGIFAFFDAPWIPIYIAVAWLLHPWLGWLAILFAVILAVIAWLGHRWTRDGNEQAMEAGHKVNTFVQNKFRNAESIQAMGMLADLRLRWLNQYRQHTDIHLNSLDLSQRVQSLTKVVQMSQLSLMLAAGAVLVIRGELSPGGMIAVNLIMARALQPVQMMVSTWTSFMAARLSYHRLVELLSMYPERTGLTVSGVPAGQVTLRMLSATVEGRGAPILDTLDAEFKPGEVVVIVGPSGSGKSTLARCLVGIWPQTSGTVLLDGTPVGDYDRHELGPHVGYLPQDVEMFEGSVAENIARFGDVDSEKVIAAAKGAGIHDMILRFPKGYDTPMGYAGGMMSAGQRQRVALARAMYGDPALLILDEPNANLDDVGEQALVRAVLQVKASGRTVFLISHRSGIVNAADRVLHLVQGRIQALGTRDQVLATLAQAQPPVATNPV